MIEQQSQSVPANEQEEYDNWKSNCGYLYDRLVIQKLTWPSLTFEWFQHYESTKDSNTYTFLYGTNTSGSEEQSDYLHIAEITFPNLKDIVIEDNPLDPSAPNIEKEVIRSRIVQSMEHEGEINRARHNRSRPEFIATKAIQGTINIYMRGREYPLQILTGHQSEGYAIDWRHQGLVSGAYDNSIFVWTDVDQPAVFSATADDKVQDTKWLHDTTFLSVGDDKKISLWDTRSTNNRPTVSVNAHKGEVYCIDVNTHNDNLLITGGEDKAVRIWDRRMFSKKLFSLQAHTNTVIRVEWCPTKPSVFCSGSLDKKIMIWDILKIGNEVPKDDTNAGPNELLFTHSGHRGVVSDLSWNPKEFMIGSVEEEHNTLQLFQMANNYTELEYVEDMDYISQSIFG